MCARVGWSGVTDASRQEWQITGDNSYKLISGSKSIVAGVLFKYSSSLVSGYSGSCFSRTKTCCVKFRSSEEIQIISPTEDSRRFFMTCLREL